MRRYKGWVDVLYACPTPITDTVIIESEVLTGRLGDDPIRMWKWKAPPHVALANLRNSPSAIRSFVLNYGPLNEPEGTDFQVPLRRLVDMQNTLRLAWRKDHQALVEIGLAASGTFRLAGDPSRAPGFSTRDLDTFIRCLFRLDYAEDRIRVCGNPTCLTPYFVRGRKDQEYCKHACAALTTLRRSRVRSAAKRQAQAGQT